MTLLRTRWRFFEATEKISRFQPFLGCATNILWFYYKFLCQHRNSPSFLDGLKQAFGYCKRDRPAVIRKLIPEVIQPYTRFLIRGVESGLRVFTKKPDDTSVKCFPRSYHRHEVTRKILTTIISSIVQGLAVRLCVEVVNAWRTLPPTANPSFTLLCSWNTSWFCSLYSAQVIKQKEITSVTCSLWRVVM